MERIITKKIYIKRKCRKGIKRKNAGRNEANER